MKMTTYNWICTIYFIIQYICGTYMYLHFVFTVKKLTLCSVLLLSSIVQLPNFYWNVPVLLASQWIHRIYMYSRYRNRKKSTPAVSIWPSSILYIYISILYCVWCRNMSILYTCTLHIKYIYPYWSFEGQRFHFHFISHFML